MENSTTFSAPFLRYLLSPKTKVLRSRISFGVKKTNIDNQYGLFSIELEDGSSMIEVVEFTVSYAPVAGIRSLCIIIAISYAEGLNIFIFDISNDFQNTISSNPVERLYTSLLYIYLDPSAG